MTLRPPHPNVELRPTEEPTPQEIVELSRAVQENFDFLMQLFPLSAGLGGNASLMEKVKATSNLSLTESYVDVPGVTFTTKVDGFWSVRGYFDFDVSSSFALGICHVGGKQVDTAETHLTAGRETVAMEWKTGFIPAGTEIKLRARRSGGSATLWEGHTCMVVERCTT
jgi:hypothetical protein